MFSVVLLKSNCLLAKLITLKMEFRLIGIFLVVLQLSATQVSGQAYYAKVYKQSENASKCILLERTFLPNYHGFHENEESSLKVELTPAVRLPEGGDNDKESPSVILAVYAKSNLLLDSELQSKCTIISEEKSRRGKSLWSSSSYNGKRRDPEVRKIVDSGDPHNRIDVVFMGDGYTSSERDKFFSDVDRFVEEMFEGVTFKSYLPVFNIWAIYVESVDTGIGYDGPKNTPFKLYRQKGQLRAVFTKNAKYAREVCKLTGEQACDYPTLMGNDDYYGGLGGEFVIFTRSHQTGKIVLRHEMGHNFLEAGEEYDNGFAYFGPNADHSLSELKWSNWLSGARKEEKAIYRILRYPWVDLQERPVNYTFLSDGRYSRWQLTVSVSGAGHEDAVEFLMDGKVLPWKTTGSDDREFYNWAGSEALSMGMHHFSVGAKNKNPNATITNMICSIALHELGSEEEYHTDNNYISAYPTWNFVRRKSYRPTNAGCVMRNMTHEHFCSVCKEGMWVNFLSYISLIDDVEISEDFDEDGRRVVGVKTLQLGQFRPQGKRVEGEYLEIGWFRNGEEVRELRNQDQLLAEKGKWTVKVNFITPEVKVDKYGVLKSTRHFEVM